MDSENRMDGCVCANGAKVAEIVHPYCPAHVPPEMEEATEATRRDLAGWMATSDKLWAENASLRAEVARCHARLEIDHHFTLNDAGETVRVDVPKAERDKDLDAVFCRDTTIAGQRETIYSLRAQLAEVTRERDALGESLTTLVYWHDHGGIDASWWTDARELLSAHAKASGGES